MHYIDFIVKMVLTKYPISKTLLLRFVTVQVILKLSIIILDQGNDLRIKKWVNVAPYVSFAFN